MVELPENLDTENPEFEKAYALLKHTSANVFLTGKAGTGKSTFLRYICENLDKKHVILAPTGVAAVNVGGMTVHSFFQMPLRPVPPDDPLYSVSSFAKSGKFSRNKLKLLRELELIVIDEVSMVRPDMIDFIDRVLRGVRGKRKIPFGGVQLLLVGDIFQLEPVVTSDTKDILSRFYPDYFFFNANAYKEANLVSVELKKIYRQTNTSFISLLDRIRLNCATEKDFRTLNSRVVTGFEESEDERFGIVLATKRDTVAAINAEKMEALPYPEVIFEGIVEDDFPERILPTDLYLSLKEDAQVMLIRNDKDKRWVNGTLARIKTISENDIWIELEDGRVEKIEKETWENIIYHYDETEKKVREEVIGRFTQYPLKAAWALTIHKSQGLTFSNVTIDMGGGAFSAGQTYVALSRCRSLEGLKFINPLRRYDVIVSRGAYEFSRNFNDETAALKVWNETEGERLAISADEAFSDGRFAEAVENICESDRLAGILHRPGVRRLISRRLSEINAMQKRIDHMEREMKEIAGEFIEMGYICFDSAGDSEAALANFEKALRLDPDNGKASLGKARALGDIGEIKKSLKLLEALKKRRGSLYFDACVLKGDIYADCHDYSNAVLNYISALKRSLTTVMWS